MPAPVVQVQRQGGSAQYSVEARCEHGSIVAVAVAARPEHLTPEELKPIESLALRNLHGRYGCGCHAEASA